MDSSARNLISLKSNESDPLIQSIFVIDDHTDTLTLHKIILGQAGYNAFTAESGVDAVSVSKAIGFIHKPAGVDKLVKSVSHFIRMGHHHLTNTKNNQSAHLFFRLMRTPC